MSLPFSLAKATPYPDSSLIIPGASLHRPSTITSSARKHPPRRVSFMCSSTVSFSPIRSRQAFIPPSARLLCALSDGCTDTSLDATPSCDSRIAAASPASPAPIILTLTSFVPIPDHPALALKHLSVKTLPAQVSVINTYQAFPHPYGT